ncbi:hypothetical protein [Aeromonas veronii]|nr:hypothetical protein [Aeromonas veronii]MCF5915272.1 hypothetical protein [Aeromonas veronii]
MSANRDKSAHALAQAVRQLMNAGALAEVLSGVENRVLTAQSGSATIAKLAAGRGAVQSALAIVITIWASDFSALTNASFALQLTALKEAVLLTEGEATQTEVV